MTIPTTIAEAAAALVDTHWLPPYLPKITGVLQYALTEPLDGESGVFVVFDNGATPIITVGISPELPTLTLTLSAEDFCKLSADELDCRAALTNKTLKPKIAPGGNLFARAILHVYDARP